MRDEAELQDQLMRFEGRFTARLLTAFRPLIEEAREPDLRSVIREWQEENPDVDDVASVRLSVHASNPDGANSKLAQHTAGLFSFVRGAARTADTAVLLGERALYAAQRLPSHLRIHARVATSDLVRDVRQGLLASSRDADAIRRADELAKRTRHWMKENLWSAAVACTGVAVVAAAAWFFARLAYARVSAR